MWVSVHSRASARKCVSNTPASSAALRGNGLLPEHGGQVGFHSFGPDTVAGGRGVEEVAHHVSGDLAIGLDEPVAEVEEANPLAVVQLVQGLIDLEGLGALGAEILSEGEDAQEQNLGVGQLFAELLDDGGHAFQNISGRVVVIGDVVDADEDDGDFGLEPVHVAVVQAPEHVLGVVAADAQVQRMTRGGILGPERFAIAFPALGDGVADEDDLGLALAFLDALVEFEELIIGLALAGDWLDALLKLRDRVGLGEDGGGQQEQGGNKVGAHGDKSIHAWSVGAPSSLFKPFQFARRGARRWSAAMPPMSSRMSTTRSWP